MKYLKNAVCVGFALLIAMSLVSCKGDNGGDSPAITTVEDASNVNADIKIVVPYESIEPEYRDDLDAYCEHYGYESAKLNKSKGTVTIKMNGFRHELLLARVGMTVIKNIYAFEKDKSYPYLVSVDVVNDKDFSTAEITVKEKAYKADGTMLPFMIGQDLLLWQKYANVQEVGATVTVKNQKGKVIDTITVSGEDE